MNVHNCSNILFQLIVNSFDEKILNIGYDEYNTSKKEVVEKIEEIIERKLEVDYVDSKDSRDYAVDFSKFKTIAPSAYPSSSLEKTVSGIWEGVKNIDGLDKNYRNSKFVRLSQLRHLRSKGKLDAELKWKQEL